MKKINLTMILFLFLISFVSAIDIYAGESYSFNLPESYDSYSIVGNSTEVNLTIEQDGLNITITTNKYSPSDEFEIIFFNAEGEKIPCPDCPTCSGGGTRTKYKTEYVDRNITKYIDKEVIKEIPGETIEVEKIVKKTSWWSWGLIIISIGVIIYTVVRGYYEIE